MVDLNNILGNPHPAGWDCGLHTCIIPVMIQEGLPLHLLGNGSVSSGREIRIRMLLSLYEKKWIVEANDLARMKCLQTEKEAMKKRIIKLNKSMQPLKKKTKEEKESINL